jgi:hypothetical protein
MSAPNPEGESSLNGDRFFQVHSDAYDQDFVFRRRSTRDHFTIGIRTRELATVPIEVFNSLTSPRATNLAYSVATLETLLVSPKTFDFMGGEEDDFALDIQLLHTEYEIWAARFRRTPAGGGTLAGAAGTPGE